MPIGGSGSAEPLRDVVTRGGLSAATRARAVGPVSAFAPLGACSCDRIGADGRHWEISKSPALDLLDHRVGGRAQVRGSGW